MENTELNEIKIIADSFGQNHMVMFAKVFCGEAVMLLDVMDKADERLRDMAYEVCRNNKKKY